MKIIDDLITELTDKTAHLTDILIKTKVLAFKLKNAELISWVDSELNGYTVNTLPDYRVIPCQIIGTISNGFQRATNYPIPLTALDSEMKEMMLTVQLTQSISVLDQFVHKETGDKMIMNVPPEMYGYLSKDFDNNFAIEFARREVGKVQIIQVLTSIRSKLLDFLLKLNEEIGETEDIKPMTEGKAKDVVSSLFSSAVFGDNVTIIVGDNNKQKVKNTNIKKGDFKALEKTLKDNGVEKSDITELQTIIDIDTPDQNNKEFGPKVKEWVKKMFGKATDTTWKVGIGVAGKLLADTIQQYYGWK